MKNKLSKNKTVGFYDAKAYDWSSSHGGFEKEAYWKDEMKRFCDSLKKYQKKPLGLYVSYVKINYHPKALNE